MKILLVVGLLFFLQTMVALIAMHDTLSQYPSALTNAQSCAGNVGPLKLPYVGMPPSIDTHLSPRADSPAQKGVPGGKSAKTFQLFTLLQIVRVKKIQNDRRTFNVGLLCS